MKLNFKKAIIRMIVKGYGISILLCMICFAIGLALLIAPIMPTYVYHESHFGAGIVAVVVPVLMVVAFAIPTKKDKELDL